MVTIIFKNNDSISIDASPSQSYNYPTRSTDHRTEQGSVISDHLINDSIEITISGYITDVSDDVTETDRHLKIKKKFEGARERKELISIETDRGRFDNMSFNFKDVVETETGKCFVIDLQLKEIRIGISKTEKYKAPKEAKGKGSPNHTTEQKKQSIKKTRDSYSNKVSKGTTATKTPNAKQQKEADKKGSSILYSIFVGGN